MELYLDSANLKDITECAQSGIITGVTVNQSLLAKEPKSDPYEHFDAIVEALSLWNFHLSLPLLGATVDEMRAAVEKMKPFWERYEVAMKVPVSWDTLPLINELGTLGEKYAINATCVFSVYQADCAVRAGAEIVSAFVGRMNDTLPDYGYKVLAAIRKRHPDVDLIAGSVRNEEMVAKCEEAGADFCTVPKNVLMALATDPHSTDSARRFSIDFEAWQNG